jgi:AmmeMemoRadiSam system protein B/AmmeMemoRadiSam system protein A
LKSSLAGTWYTADANDLREQIAGYVAKAQVEPREDTTALVLPHAGYAYSGPTAAYGIKSLGRDYQRVVVIGPTHRLPMEDTFSVPRVTHYETPLGEAPLDVEFIGKLLAYPLFQSIPAAHQQEHSVQIEVPLLQHKLGDFRLVPIVAGQCSREIVAQAGRILAGLIDADTLVVASSDFTHYGPQYRYVPFREHIPESIKKLDMGAFEHIRRLDAAGLLSYRDRTQATICGCVPVAVLLDMLGQGTQVELLKYATSAEATGDYSNSVSYMTIAFRGAWGASALPQSATGRATLTDEERKQLLTLVRRTIRYALDHQKIPTASDLDFVASEPMKQPRAAFVTLKKDGQLRGCIGDIFPQRPLYKSVIGNAIYAAFGDRRFGPLASEEYDRIKVEISALTAPAPVTSPQEIRIGIDGVVLNKDGRSAVFLPQVATEQGWDLETTLGHLSTKAGLPADAWKQGASFLVFQADVFGEEL